MLEANALFYKAFNSADLEAMGRVWGTGDFVSCMHPGMGNIVGREQVMKSWKSILRAGARETMRVKCEAPRAVTDRSVSIVTCTEVTTADDMRGLLAATNVF